MRKCWMHNFIRIWCPASQFLWKKETVKENQSTTETAGELVTALNYAITTQPQASALISRKLLENCFSNGRKDHRTIPSRYHFAAKSCRKQSNNDHIGLFKTITIS